MPRKKTRKEGKYRERNELFFCEGCDHSWERYWMGHDNVFVRYGHMPTYKLERRECHSCRSGELYVAG